MIIKNKNKKGAFPLLAIVAIVFIVGAIFIGNVKTADLVGSGSYIERPVFYYDKCEATSGLKYSTWYDIPTNGYWVKTPSVTNQYKINVKIVETKILTCPYVSYSICNSQINNQDNCRVFNNVREVSKGQQFEINGVKNNEQVKLYYYSDCGIVGKDLKGLNGGQYQIGFTPYGIRQYNVLGGSANSINPNSCTYPSTQKDTILSTNADDINDVYKGVDKSTNERVLQPEEVRWYVGGYVTSAGPSFALTYKNQDAWCRPTGTSAEIYAINTITTSGGTYKIASADWSDLLGTATCCPGQTRGSDVCGDDLKWKVIEESECGGFKSCGSPNWVPYSEGVIIKYSCVSGSCEKQTKDVECASNFDCKDSNQVCDLNKFECVQANVNLEGQVIDTIPDSQAECIEKGGKWITKESKDRSFLNLFGIGQPDIIVEEYCQLGKKVNVWKILLAVGIILVIILLFKFIKPLLNGIRGFLKGLPLIGRIIP